MGKLYLKKTIAMPITKEVQNLKNFPCAAVILSVSNTTDDANDTPKTPSATSLAEFTGEEVYWGHGGVCGHQLFPTQTTDYIFVKDLSDISIRANRNNSAKVTVYASLFGDTDELK